MLARPGLRPFAFAGGDDQVETDLVEGLAVLAAAQQGVQHVVGDGRGVRRGFPCGRPR